MLGLYNYPPQVSEAMNEMYRDPDFTRQWLLINGGCGGFLGVSMLGASWKNAAEASPENVARLQQAKADWTQHGPITDEAAKDLFAHHPVIAPAMKDCGHRAEFKACVEQAITPVAPKDQHIGDFAAFGALCTVAAAAALFGALRPRKG